MKNKIEVKNLSEKYDVRRMTVDDVELIYALCESNPQSNHFWKKNGFEVVKEVAREDGVILVAEKLFG